MSVAEDKDYTLNIGLRLVVNGRTLRVGQVFEHSLVLDDKCDLPPGEAELIVAVRGEEKRYAIFLPQGIDAKTEVTSFV